MRRSNRVTEKTVEAILTKWRPLLGIDARWNITTKIYGDDEEWPLEDDSVAAVRPSPGYFQASMRINAKSCEKDAHTLEHIVLHELVHIVLWPLSRVARDGLGEDHEATWRDIMEATVEQMTRALLRKREVK
jgi:hypothetical protein